MGSDKPDGQGFIPVPESGVPDGAKMGRHTVTQVGLIVVITLVFASVGFMMVLLLAMSTSTGSGWRAVLAGLTSPGTIGFAVFCPLSCALVAWVLRRLSARRGWNRRTLMLLIFAAWILIATISAFIAWGSAALLVLQFGWGGLLPLGMGFVTHGLTRRIGEEPHCAHCGYAFDEEVQVCPECGAPWKQRGGVLSGRLERSRAFVAVGAACLVLAVLLTIRPLIGHVLGPLVPTSVLIAQASGQDVWSQQDWTELSSRQLSSQQVQVLAEGLLNRRWATGRLDRAPTSWLEQQVVSGMLKDETKGQFYREMVVMHLRGPKTATVGQPVRVEAMVDDRSTPFGGIGARVLFAGFSIDGVPVGGSRLGRYTSVYAFDEWSVKRKPDASLPGVGFEPQRAGLVTVEAEAWIIYGPEAALGWGQAWNVDGSPAIPAGATWTQHVVLELEVDVRAK